MNIRVTTWNIFRGKNVEEVINVLQKCNSDIILLQEVLPDDTIAKRLQYAYHYCKGQIIGNAVLSRFPIASTSCQLLNLGVAYDMTPSTEPRFATVARITIETYVLNVISTHLYYPHHTGVSIEPAVVQQESLAKLLKNEHIILGGDFNIEGNMGELNMLKSLTECGAGDDRPTFNDIKYTGERRKFDHIFVSPEYKVVSYEVTETTASDHNPVTVELTLSELQ